MLYKCIVACLVFALSGTALTARKQKKEIPWRVEQIASQLDGQHVAGCRFSEDGQRLLLSIAPKGQEAWPQKPDTEEKFLVFDRGGRQLKEYRIPKSDGVVAMALSHELDQLAVCHRRGDVSELVIWSDKTATNIFQLSDISCGSQLAFANKDRDLYLISSDHSGNLAVWDAKKGIRKKLPEPFLQQKCLAVNASLDQAYCAPLGKPGVVKMALDSGKVQWTASLGEGLSGKWWQKAGNWLEANFGLELPSFFYYVAQKPPQLLSVSSQGDKVVAYYRWLNTKRSFEKSDYPSYLFSFDDQNGKTMEKMRFSEARDLNLVDLRMEWRSMSLVGEDLTGKKDEWRSLFVLHTEASDQKRFSDSCLSDWDFAPGGKEILTCGFCQGKSSLRFWPL